MKEELIDFKIKIRKGRFPGNKGRAFLCSPSMGEL
jgi:hypothetical protein